MSNHYSLVCLSHEGGEHYSDEVGNNNAKPASIVMANRENIIKAAELLENLDMVPVDLAEAHWDSNVQNAIRFVIKHPTCEIELRDEYGAVVPFEGQPDPHEGEDRFCPKCRGRLGRVGTPVGNGETSWQNDVCVAQNRDRDLIAFVHWFKKGYNYVLQAQIDPDQVEWHKTRFPGFEEGYLSALSGAHPFSDEGQRIKATQLYAEKLERENKE